MPPVIVLMFAIVVVLLFLITRSARGSTNSTAKRTTAVRREVSDKFAYKGTPLAGIGLRSEVPLYAAVMRLEHAFAEGDFAERIKYRVLQRHPRMSSAEYDWHLRIISKSWNGWSRSR